MRRFSTSIDTRKIPRCKRTIKFDVFAFVRAAALAEQQMPACWRNTSREGARQ
jgi:hypothetical protein